MPKPRARFVALADLLARRRPDTDPRVIGDGRVLVDGRVLTNPAAQVRLDAAVRVLPERRLRGDMKLSRALEILPVEIADRVALDLGASAGGFTTALLAAGASRVYAVDAGVGQLLGRLRHDARVVNLEGRNVGELERALVPEPVAVVTADLGYLALSDAIPQLESLDIAPDADLIALVKPTFELRRARLAAAPEDVAVATRRAAEAIKAAGWSPLGWCDALRTGRRGAREVFLHARRDQPGGSHRGHPA